jgi:AcrR family transcriptional regulator
VRLLAEQMAERRERILSAAREIIGERGYEALTMRELARRSRVTVPTIYNLVGGKEELLFAAVEEQTARFVASIGRVDAATPATRVLAVVEASSRELLRMPGYYRSLLRLLFSSPGVDPERATVSQALETALEHAVAELERTGELAAWADPRVLVERLLAHLVFTSVQWAGGEVDREGLPAASVYEACLLLMAVTEGAPRRELEKIARDVQARARLRSSKGAPTRTRRLAEARS